MKRKSRFRFNTRALDRLEPQPKDAASSNYEVSDEVEIGLRIAVFKSGRMSWRLRYRIDGKQGTVTYGTYPVVSIDKAREMARASKLKIAEGNDPRQEKLFRREVPSLKEFTVEVYLPFAERERRSISDIRSRLNGKILPAFGKKQLHHIHAEDVRIFVDKLANDISGTTANRTKSLLSSILNLAVEYGYIKTNPARGIAKRKENSPRVRYMTDEEATRFLRVAKKRADTGDPSAQALLILFVSGLRKSEVLGMRWQNVNLQQGALYLPNPKNGQPRSAPLNSLAVAMLTEIQETRGERSPFVFPSPSRSGHMHEVRRALASIKKEADIEGITTHDLRRGFSSMLAQMGEDLRTIGEIIGHRDFRTTQKVYAHLGNNKLRQASERIAGKVEELLAAPSP